jgi:hypothetical protein
MTPQEAVTPQPDPELVARALLLDSQLGPSCASTDAQSPDVEVNERSNKGPATERHSVAGSRPFMGVGPTVAAWPQD